MKTTFAGIPCVLLLLVSACAQKVNDPADVQAVKKSIEDYAKAVNAGDADGVAAVMADKAIYADLNLPVAVGKEAIRSQTAAFNNLFKFDFTCPVEDVRVAGDLAVARGSWTVKLTPKAQGVALISNGGSWIVVFARQNDGSWKWDWCVPNSSQPLPGSTASGEDEQAIYQLERDWGAAGIKNDAKTIERFLADEFISNWNGKVTNKRQALAEVTSNPAKIESAVGEDMRVAVFGNIAVVHGLYIEKSTTQGKDTSGQYRFTEVYTKRDSRWQCVTQYGTKVQ
jgi:uncharacterized protein (TIGR02246 family)